VFVGSFLYRSVVVMTMVNLFSWFIFPRRFMSNSMFLSSRLDMGSSARIM